MMNKLLVGCVMFMSAIGGAQAQSSQSYMGAELVYSMVGFNESALGQRDYNAPGFRLFFGSKINEMSAWEVAYFYVGKKEVTHVYSSLSVKNTTSIHIGEVAYKFHPVAQMKMLYLRAGGLLHMTTANSESANSYSKHTLISTGVVVGGGLDFPINDRLTLGAQYNYYHTFGSVTEGRTTTSLGVGIHKFGGSLSYAF